MKQTSDSQLVYKLFSFFSLAILVITSFSTHATSIAYAQDQIAETLISTTETSTPEGMDTLTPTAEPPACYTLELIVAAGEGTLIAITPQNCEGGYLLGSEVAISAQSNDGYIITAWEGTQTDSGLETVKTILIQYSITVKVYFDSSEKITDQQTTEGISSDSDLQSTSIPDAEQIQSLSGWFSIIWGDNIDDSQSDVVYMLSDGKGQTTLLSINDSVAQSLGGLLGLNRKYVTVYGTQKPTSLNDQEITTFLVTDISLVRSSENEPPSAGVTGSLPWITILCKFSDIAVEPKNLAFFQGMYANTSPGLDHFWREQSYNIANVAGSNASGWFVLPEVEAHYEHTNPEGLNHLATDCISAADSSVNFSLYTDGGINMMFNFDWYNGWAWGGSWTGTLDGVTQSWRTNLGTTMGV